MLNLQKNSFVKMSIYGLVLDIITDISMSFIPPVVPDQHGSIVSQHHGDLHTNENGS